MHLEGLPIGGGTITAIELGGVLHADLGWDVVVCAAPGPATAMLEERGLRYAPAPAGAGGTGAARVRALVEVCARESPALVHAWDWRAIHTAHVGPWLVRGTPVLGTITEMQVPPGLPAGIHVTAVTEDLSRQHADPARVHVLDPPVNDVLDDPAVVDDRAFRTEHFSPDRAVHIVVVSRLARAMKAEGIHQAIDAVALLPEHLAAELVIVGDGDAEDDLRHAAAAAEARAGRALVRFAGPMLDPRAAYKAADIVVGMGTSAARALAFGRPVVVVGEGGFCRTFAPGTAAQLIGAGFYGTAPFRGEPALAVQLAQLASDPAERDALGAWARPLIAERFGARKVAAHLADIYRETVSSPERRGPRELARAVIESYGAANIMRRERRAGVAA
ncbi:MAG TPA: glycosyltransferase family 4 protein [Acidimicrobiales bacterium]|nr:glycosyltransferase family 4 protein [Acidimicrobiales bacterium]